MTKVMAIWTSVVAVLGLTVFAGARPARAIEYPWCLVTALLGGSENCGFTSFVQCQAGTFGHWWNLHPEPALSS